MRILLLGGSGMLGHDLRTVLAGHAVTAPTRAELDLADDRALHDAIAGMDAVVNSAAYTAVDAAEDDEAAAREVNALAAGRAAGIAAEAGSRFIQVSTDYVFDGRGTSPYREDAPLDPRNAYGRTKAEGERVVTAAHPSPIIVRTAWLYGAHGTCFPRAILTRAASHETIDVVDDQYGQPTWTADLAVHIRQLLELGAPAGVYHGTNSGAATWFEFARAVFVHAGLDPDRVRAVSSSAFPRRATRPAYSVLGHEAWNRAGLEPMRDWHDALAAAAASGVLEAT